jgi:hypothetical protein
MVRLQFLDKCRNFETYGTTGYKGSSRKSSQTEDKMFVFWAAVAALSIVTFGVFAVVFFPIYYMYHGGPKGRRILAERRKAELLNIQLRQKQLSNQIARLGVPDQALTETAILSEKNVQAQYKKSLTKLCRNCQTLVTGKFCSNCGSPEFTLV